MRGSRVKMGGSRVNRKYGLAVFVALAVLLMVACGPKATPVPTAAPTEAPTAAPTVAVATSTPVPTATTAPTSTPVPTPVIALPTNTPEPTPVATIDLEAAKSDQPPHVFVGTAKIDGVAAPRGTFVGVMIGDQIVASSRVGSDGDFGTILVEIPDYEVTFQVGDYPASQPAIMTQKGGATVLELDASSN